jgi:LysM repeat protein
MNRKSSIRTIIIFMVIGILAIGLTSCKLPASMGPESTSDGFPVPGGSVETSSSIDVSTFATQTAQALPTEVIAFPTPMNNPTENPTPGVTSVSPYPAPTEIPIATEIPSVTETAIVYVQATPGGPPETHTMQQGEYPYCIARRFDVDSNELLSINGLTNNSLISPGDVLKIPQTGNPFIGERTLKPHPDYYEILSGDTLGSIACSYGDVSPDMIALQNNITDENYDPGDVIIIP